MSPDAALALLDHDWPHNVRELEQALAGALALAIAGADRARTPASLRCAKRAGLRRRRGSSPPMSSCTGSELVALLGQHRGNLSAVARAVGKGRTQVVRWMERYGLDAEAFRT